jgi:hypothetical protein
MAEVGFGSPALSPSEAPYGKWLTFRGDGSADYMYKTGLTITEFDADWSVGMWLWADALAGAQVVLAMSDGGTEYMQFQLTGNKVVLAQGDSGGPHTLTSTGSLSVGTWHHVLFERRTNTYSIYIDGVVDPTTLVLATRAAGMDRVYAASNTSGGAKFGGMISQLAIWERFLTAGQLTEIVGSPFAINPSRLPESLAGKVIASWPTAWGAAPTHQWFCQGYVAAYDQQNTLSYGADQGDFVYRWPLDTLVSITEANAVIEEPWPLVPLGDSLIHATAGAGWGFGSPDPSDFTLYAGDTGFGSPFIDVYSVQILDPLAGYGDDGGYIVEVFANWPVPGPYRFSLIDGGDTYPEGGGYCYSGIATQGSNCYTFNVGAEVVRFVLPPAPPATYDLKIEWGANFGQSTTAIGAVVVVPRNRARDTYAVRRRLPAHYKAGPATSRRDPLV